GLPDVFLTYPLKRADQRNTLLHNLGNFKFARVPLPALDEISAHPEKHGLIAGAVFVDFDNSGRQSLFLTTGWGKVRLLKNKGGPAERPDFQDITEAAGLDEYTVSVAATLADFDRDGDLDLFIGNAMAPELPGYDPPERFNIFDLPEPRHEGDRRMFHFMHSTWHNARNGGRNVFLRQTSSGIFQREDIAALGMPETHWTIALGTADLNQDGWTDIYCASDYGPDDLYLNQSGRGFHHVEGTFTGSIGRDTYKGMNVSIGDLDNRGWQDVHVSNVHAPLQAEGSLVWRVEPDDKADGGIRLRDEASPRRLVNESRFGWGAVMGDLNLDGWLDLVQANGMVDDTADKIFAEPRDYWYRASQVMRAGPEVHSYADRWADLRGHEIWGRQQNRVYLSHGASPARFSDVADTVGLTEKTNSRAAVLADFDNDGDLDLVLTHQFAPAEIRRNTRMESAGNDRPHWIGFLLQGDGNAVSRDAVGAQVFVKTADLQQMREVSLTSGFSGQSDRRLHFGLGKHSGPVDVLIRWPGGGTQGLKALAVDSYHTIVFAKPPVPSPPNSP
ncbi:MAG: CRTAC1 family protein, partial [bacterium]|nr:CRTAC1 family protein [bacterium]